jgi:hypothetical protein
MDEGGAIPDAVQALVTGLLPFARRDAANGVVHAERQGAGAIPCSSCLVLHYEISESL